MIGWHLLIIFVISISTLVKLFTMVLYWLKPVSITEYLVNVYYDCWLFSYFPFLTYIKMHIFTLVHFYKVFLYACLTWFSICFHFRFTVIRSCILHNTFLHWTDLNIELDIVLQIIVCLFYVISYILNVFIYIHIY